MMGRLKREPAGHRVALEWCKERQGECVKAAAPMERHKGLIGCADFCNKIGTFRTWRDARLESVMRNKADVRRSL
jgi:hypothetical protein